VIESIQAKLGEELQRNSIDAYIAYTPGNIFYTTGFASPLKSIFWRMWGGDLAVIPANGLSPALILSDFVAPAAPSTTNIADIRTYRTWVENRELDIISATQAHGSWLESPTRPAQFDLTEVHRILQSILIERDLQKSVIGTDLRYMHKETYDQLVEKNPGCTFVDCTDLLYTLRAVKYPEEITSLRNAALLFESGVNRSIKNLKPDHSAQVIKHEYLAGVISHVLADRSLGEYRSSFGFVSAGNGSQMAFGTQNQLQSTDLIKFDCGAILNGYASDCGRTFVCGKATGPQKQMYEALASTHETIRSMMKPGIKLSEIAITAEQQVRDSGFPNYTRGHFGHSIGLDDFVEEPPFIATNDHSVLVPGMVMCIETPYYSKQLGSIQIEDMILITESGHENFNSLTYDLVEV
tara:strand:+ start:934 stop:2160 length:1227 start_codon:yes stop_codon:yes gene_type:complete